MRLTIGADPELFLESSPGGFVRSAIGFIGGTKEMPLELSRPGYFVQEDNVAAEFNIPAATTEQEFVDSIHWTIKEITERVKNLGFRPRLTASEIFPSVELNSAAARAFGCEPDFNAWTGARNPRPHAKDDNLRSCGGHVHAAVNMEVDVAQMIQAQDLFLGVPSVMLDVDIRRRELYGRAGAHRTTNYDVTSWEYRVLSNFWLRSPELTRWVFNQTQRAVEFAAGFTADKWKEWIKKDNLHYKIVSCINNSDVDLSQKLIANYDLKLA